MTKVCIWCRKQEAETLFKTEAHTIPKSLGGTDICVNVCDACNYYFGNHSSGYLSIETIIKETFNITRVRFLSAIKQVGRNKALTRPSSCIFDINIDKNTVKLKKQHLFRRGYLEGLGRQLRKGIFKMFLEETERQLGNGKNDQFDFIREFSRYDLGDYPVLYFERITGIFLLSDEWIKSPKFFIDPDHQYKYLVSEPGFFEFELMGHVFGIPTTRIWDVVFDNYLKKSMSVKAGMFHKPRFINKLTDVDITLNIIDRENQSTK